jgi:Tfp pilus assembly protein PilN
MRPVNLIPADQRRHDGGGSKSGVISYAIIGLLAVAVVGVTVMTLLDRQLSDKQSEIATLEATAAETDAQAQGLAPFISFADRTNARVDTVTALAQSRFDWERVIRELTLVLPNRVWLTSLIGSVSPSVAVSDGESVDLRASIPGPALELVGCAKSQREVASLISALGDIDGVTRVAVGRSEKPESGASDASAGSNNATADCRTRDFITRFEAVAAFDSIPVPAGAVPGPEADVSPADTSSTDSSSTDSSSTDSSSTDSSTTESSTSTSGETG